MLSAGAFRPSLCLVSPLPLFFCFHFGLPSSLTLSHMLCFVSHPWYSGLSVSYIMFVFGSTYGALARCWRVGGIAAAMAAVAYFLRLASTGS